MLTESFVKLILITAVVDIVNGETNFVDKDSKLRDFFEPQWFKDNIPFVEVPDKEIEDVYYYRWSSLKRHLRYTIPGAGYIITEFVHKVGYSQKFDTINAAAGHHIYEARWLRNSRYVQDYINFWSREGGAAQQYSEWIADAAYKSFLVNGDVEFIKSQQFGLVNNFNSWNDRFEPTLGLYFISPHDDAMEMSASSVQTEDPYHGGLGYRPSFNSEMYANALAIFQIATLNGDYDTAEEFRQRAASLKQSILTFLWDDDRKFFYHMFRDNNPNNKLLDTREEIGFFPWRFMVPDETDRKYNDAWQELFDSQGFDSLYGPTTCEMRSQWYDGNQTSQCCWWNGNSWPYSTGHTLNSLASQIKNYSGTFYANVESFVQLLHKYAETQFKNGKPYVAECHSPTTKLWVCDGFNHSDHYAHSTYTDNVLGDLIGIEPQSGDVFKVDPLVPSSWDYFIAENIAYHGHNITVLYDRDGSRYRSGSSGMQIFVNGEMVARQNDVGPMRVAIPSSIQNFVGSRKVENYAANVDGYGYPMVDASFTSIHASVWHVVDGRIFYDHIPTNRWTNYASPNPTDWFSLDFGPGRYKTINQIKLYVYSDVATGEGEVDCYKSITVEVFNGQNWTPVQNQVSVPPACINNDVNIVEFTPVNTRMLRVVFVRDEERNHFVGLTEMEIWAPWPQTADSYEAEDGWINEANVRESSTASGGSYVGQINDNAAFVEFTGVWVETAGDYAVHVYYANGENVAAMNVRVNNIHSNIAIFPGTGSWGEFSRENFIELNVPLLRGNNVIIFENGINFVELDKIVILTDNENQAPSYSEKIVPNVLLVSILIPLWIVISKLTIIV